MIREGIEKILADYRDKRVTPTASREDPLYTHICGELPQGLASLASLGGTYITAGSAGAGNWAKIPWLSVFDTRVTETAQSGYYIVYLFRADMEGVYLSLNQGFTQYKEKYKKASTCRDKILGNARKFEEILKTPLEDFSFGPIELHSDNELGTGYELGNICAKYYSRGNVPEDRVLIDDLRNLISVYRELYGRIGPRVFTLEDYEIDSENEGSLETYKQVTELTTKAIQSKEDLTAVLTELEEKLKDKAPKERERLAKTFSRNQKIIRVVKELAGFRCQICGEEGFQKDDGTLYCEAHHKEELSSSRLDLPSNLICVCPTCHRVLHHGSDKALKARYQLGEERIRGKEALTIA